jgi:hypothetical protein
VSSGRRRGPPPRRDERGARQDAGADTSRSMRCGGGQTHGRPTWRWGGRSGRRGLGRGRRGHLAGVADRASPASWPPSDTRWAGPDGLPARDSRPDHPAIAAAAGPPRIRGRARPAPRGNAMIAASRNLLGDARPPPLGPAALAEGSPGTTLQAADPDREQALPSELIMTHQAEIGLEDRQRESDPQGAGEGPGAVSRGCSGSFRPRASSSRQLLDESPINEAKAHGAGRRGHEAGNGDQGAPLGLVIRIRNVLSDAQAQQAPCSAPSIFRSQRGYSAPSPVAGIATTAGVAAASFRTVCGGHPGCKAPAP